MQSFTLLTLLATASSTTDHWAVLIASSNTYLNYRHQADVCHAYQLLVANHFSPENIIVFAFDDVANDKSNPFPGQLFNKPTKPGVKGFDVYKGCKIDYAGAYVTPQNFVKVLTGDDTPLPAATSVVEEGKKCGHKGNTTCETADACCCTKYSFLSCAEWTCCDAATQACARDAGAHSTASHCKTVNSGRVLRSTNSSRVFVNFVNHGAVGHVMFPRGAGSLHATELMSALRTMHAKGMYKELVFYLEACHSGSMFQDLPRNMSVYTQASARADELAYAYYCGGMHDPWNVDGRPVGSCLGDLYSITWMEDSDARRPAETVEEQYTRVRAGVNKSHVLQFGDQARARRPHANPDAVLATHATVPSLLARAEPDPRMASCVVLPLLPRMRDVGGA